MLIGQQLLGKVDELKKLGHDDQFIFSACGYSTEDSFNTALFYSKTAKSKSNKKQNNTFYPKQYLKSIDPEEKARIEKPKLNEEQARAKFVSEERIRQLEAKAKLKLQALEAKSKLQSQNDLQTKDQSLDISNDLLLESAVNLNGSYLSQIGRIPILSPEEEKKLAPKLLEMKQLLEKLTDKDKTMRTLTEKAYLSCKYNHISQQKIINKINTVAFKELIEFGMKLASKEDRQKLRKLNHFRNKIRNANLRLVIAIAKRYMNQGVEFYELINEGSLGLERALNTFDQAEGYIFSKYAVCWIRMYIANAIENPIDKKARKIWLSKSIRERESELLETIEDLFLRLGRRPTKLEIAHSIGVNPNDLDNCVDTLLTLKK